MGRTPYRTHSLGDGSEGRREKGLKTVCLAPRCTSGHIAYSIVLSSVSLIGDHAGTVNVLTYTVATYHVAGLFLR